LTKGRPKSKHVARQPAVSTRPASRARANAIAIAGIVLALSTIVVFAPVRHFDFVTYDDFDFVVENPHVNTGLTLANLSWAFAHPYSATGGPLTWLSHMLDVQLFGLHAGSHHLMSLAIHVCNALLLLLVLTAMTGALGRSLCVATLFAVHPLHVESVAWVAERKDVLSTLFWLLTTGAYLAYVRGMNAWRYFGVIALFTMGLMSKVMVATLPVTLLLLDLWPLRRWDPDKGWRLAAPLVREKIPLFALAAVATLLTFAAQQRIGAVADFGTLPLGVRVSNAAVSYIAYIGKFFWPVNLVPFYPYRESLSPYVVLTAFGTVAALTAAAVIFARRMPWMTVGWFWYLGTLVPVIGIVQIGGHAMADRFTYVPLIGLFIMLVWGGYSLLAHEGTALKTAACVAIPMTAACMLAARAQVLHWQNGITLWEHAIGADPANARAHANLGVSFDRDGRRDEAVRQYRRALVLDANLADTHNNLALALARDGRRSEALHHYQEALRVRPGYANAHTNLANLLDEEGRTEEAIAHYREAIRSDPENSLARLNLAVAFARAGQLEHAIPLLEHVLEHDPTSASARRLLDQMQRERRQKPQ